MPTPNLQFLVEDETQDQVINGHQTSNAEAPPDLRLRSHPMRLSFKDDRVNDPEVRAWMEERRLGVGASEIAVLFGLSPWQNLRELWHQKVHGCSYEPGNELFHFGHEMEPLIAAEFSRRSGEAVDHPPQAIIVGSKPTYRASLDRVVLEDGVPVAALELKNLHEGRFQEYKVAGPSIGYLLQLQYQMACAELEYGYLAVLFGGQKFAAWRVVASPSIQREIFRRVDEFWGYVERKEEPPESLAGRAIAKTEATTLTLTDPSWERKLEMLEEIRLKKAKLDKEEKLIKAQIKEELGDYASAEAGSMKVSLSISSRRSLDTSKLREQHPQLVEEFTREAQVKTLRIRKQK